MKGIVINYTHDNRPKRLIASRIETISELNEHITEHRLRGNYSSDYYLHDAGKYEDVSGNFVTNFELYELL